MFRSAITYLGMTVAIALFAMVLGVTGAIVAGGDSSRSGLVLLGGLIFFFSPVISGAWFWFRRRKARSHAFLLQAEQNAMLHRLAKEESDRDFLRRRFLERQRLIDAVDRHRVALTRNLQRAVTKNDYGSIVSDSTHEALREFFASIALDEAAIGRTEASELVFEQLDFRRAQDRELGFDPGNIPFDGHSFENWVAEALVAFGWQSEITAASGDQGIDVVASKNGKRLGLQCKLHSAAVGNKAIQEAHAGKVYYRLDAAAVVTNANFTSSARDLATATGVWLLSHHDIPFVYEKVFGAR